MKILFFLLLTLLLLGCEKDISPDSKSNQELEINTTVVLKEVQVEKQFASLWNEILSDPLEKLPQNEVSFSKLFTLTRDIIFEDANRTLSTTKDILPRFEKLAHPNGVCLKGIWQIDKENIYSGYFKKGKRGLVIARASSAMSNTKKGEIRAFGLAIKLFPTMDELNINVENTANFFVIDDLGGTKSPYFMGVSLTNEPPISTNSEVVKFIAYGAKVASAFSEADENPNIRQLYKVSYLSEAYLDKVSSSLITPKWIKIEAKEGQINRSVEDFREEFRFNNKRESLIFTISVASRESEEKKEWLQIGTITFNDSVVSDTCDHRLHFPHPKWRDDLRYE